MELNAAQQLASRLLSEFGLAQQGWIFDWDDAKRRFGSCSHRRKTITLSRVLTLRNEPKQVEDTIRHEIAHALCDAKEHHGPAWKAMCVRVGANPERCFDSEEVDTPMGDWRATCGGCGRVHHKFRRPKRDLWCAYRDCKRDNPAPFGQRFNPACKLNFKHVNAIDITKPSREAIEAMKAQLRQEQDTEALKDKVAQLEKRLGIKPGEGWNRSRFQAR